MGHDGAVLHMRKLQSAISGSGTEMFERQFASILQAVGLREAFAVV